MSFGYFSSPEIDRESDLLREIERLQEQLEQLEGSLAERDAMISLLQDEVEICRRILGNNRR